MTANALVPLAHSSAAHIAGSADKDFVTMHIGEQMFGISVEHVQDVLRLQPATRVPLASEEIVGLLNLRGRVVTALDVRKRLGLPPCDTPGKRMNIVVSFKDELFSLMVDGVGDVMNLPMDKIEKAPANLAPAWLEVAVGIYRLEEKLLVVLDVQRLLRL